MGTEVPQLATLTVIPHPNPSSLPCTVYTLNLPTVLVTHIRAVWHQFNRVIRISGVYTHCFNNPKLQRKIK